MKQTVRYQSLAIAGKLRTEVRIVVDDTRNPVFSNEFQGDRYTTLVLFPSILISLTKAAETDESGNRVRAAWNPNDNLGMTKYQLPIMINELNAIHQSLKLPEMYRYVSKRLEINEEISEKARRVFLIGNITIELSAVVISQLDDSRVEGVKMKFNNEQSSVLLTLNEFESLLFTLKTMDVDSIAILLYTNFITKSDRPKVYNQDTLNLSPKVDIAPKESITGALPSDEI